MTARDFLLRARRLQTRIDRLEDARRDAWERATSVTPSATKSRPGSGGVTRRAESYGELGATIMAEQRRLNRIKAEIIDVISEVDDNILAALLLAYYVNGKTWEETAVQIHYSYYRTVKNKHPQALRAVDEILERRQKRL